MEGSFFLPEVPGHPSATNSLNSCASSLFCHHLSWQGHSLVHLHSVHMDHREWLPLFLMHDHVSPIQHLSDKGKTESRELQLRPSISAQLHVMDPYQYPGPVLSFLDLPIIVVLLMHGGSMQANPGMLVCSPQSILQRCHILAHRLLLWSQFQRHSLNSLDRQPSLSSQHHHVRSYSHACPGRHRIPHQNERYHTACPTPVSSLCRQL